MRDMYDVTITNVTFDGNGDRVTFNGIVSEEVFIELLRVIPLTPAYKWEVVHVIQDN